MTQPASLIINSPYEVPRQHWRQERDGSLALTEERRPAGYEIFDARHNTKRTEELELVNQIRTRVVIRDDASPVTTTCRSRLYHSCRDAEVDDNLNRRDVTFVPARMQDILARHRC